MISFRELFKTNLRVVYRNRAGVFWNLILPAALYVALAILPIAKLIGTGVSYANFLLPGIMALTIMQSGIYSLAYWLVELKSQGVLKRFLVTPIKKTELVLSLIAARVLVMIAQVVMLTLIGAVFFNVQVNANFALVLFFTLLGGFVFLSVGLLISTLADSYEAAAPITSAIGLPLSFLSSVFYPLEILPSVLQKIANFLPITHLADALRALYLGPANFLELFTNALVLLIWLLILLGLTFWRLKLETDQ